MYQKIFLLNGTIFFLNKKMYLKKIQKEEIINLKKVVGNDFKTSKNNFYLNKLINVFSNLTCTKYSIPLSSGTAALHTALASIDLKKNDEVILSSLSMSSPLLTILSFKAKPVFIDIDEKNFNLSFLDLQRKITKKTKAIIIVNIYGLLIDYEKLNKILKESKTKIYVIEDSAEAIFSRNTNLSLQNKKKLIDFTVYSFQSSKIIKSGEGGMLCTNQKKLFYKAKNFSNLGYKINNKNYNKRREDLKNTNFSRHHEFGLNFRMPELCAAVLLPQLKFIEKILFYRLMCAKKYSEIVRNYPKVTSQLYFKGINHSYWTFPILFDNYSNYKIFKKKFKDFGGDNFYGSWKVPYLEPFYKKYYKKNFNCISAEKIQKNLIQLNTSYKNISDIYKQARALTKTFKYIYE